MVKADTLWLMFDRFAIDDSHTKVFHNCLMDRVTLEFSISNFDCINQTYSRPLTKSSTVHFVERSTTGCV